MAVLVVAEQRILKDRVNVILSVTSAAQRLVVLLAAHDGTDTTLPWPAGSTLRWRQHSIRRGKRHSLHGSGTLVTVSLHLGLLVVGDLRSMNLVRRLVQFRIVREACG